MKLNLYFMAMDLLTLLVYPVLYLLDKLHRLVKIKVTTPFAGALPAVLVVLDE